MFFFIFFIPGSVRAIRVFSPPLISPCLRDQESCCCFIKYLKVNTRVPPPAIAAISGGGSPG